mmetsp:Transcript_53949/g.151610  ORF Transcript_53949/g.151610 Transcript_53949/m.151610 type:complete len:268 (+) Transcript_53949:536-1339(+)
MHLRRLVCGLADGLHPGPLRAGHAEIDDPDGEGILAFREQDVLQGQVSMRETEAVQPPHGVEDLHDHRQQASLPGAPRRVAHGAAEREEVPLRRQLGDDVGALVVPVDAHEAAGVGEAAAAQLRDRQYVEPGPLRLLRVSRRELLGARADPLVRDSLRGHEPPLNNVGRHQHLPAISRSVHQLTNEGEAVRLPRGDARGRPGLSGQRHLKGRARRGARWRRGLLGARPARACARLCGHPSGGTDHALPPRRRELAVARAHVSARRGA